MTEITDCTIILVGDELHEPVEIFLGRVYREVAGQDDDILLLRHSDFTWITNIEIGIGER